MANYDFETMRSEFGGMSKDERMARFIQCVQKMRQKFDDCDGILEVFADDEWLELENIKDFLACYLACEYCTEHGFPVLFELH